MIDPVWPIVEMKGGCHLPALQPVPLQLIHGQNWSRPSWVYRGTMQTCLESFYRTHQLVPTVPNTQGP